MSEPLVSWRAWLIEDFILKALVVKAVWNPGVVMEKSHRDYGIYSWKNAEDAIDYMRQWSALTEVFCFGEVYNWGKIQECRKGYQSEYAYPKKLYIFNNQELSQVLQRLYGCEVINLELKFEDFFEDMRLVNEFGFSIENKLPKYEDALQRYVVTPTTYTSTTNAFGSNMITLIQYE